MSFPMYCNRSQVEAKYNFDSRAFESLGELLIDHSFGRLETRLFLQQKSKKLGQFFQIEKLFDKLLVNI